MELTLYHGSENQIEVPQYGKGARTNDYGRGFYCTESKELAKEGLAPKTMADIPINMYWIYQGLGFCD